MSKISWFKTTRWYHLGHTMSFMYWNGRVYQKRFWIIKHSHLLIDIIVHHDHLRVQMHYVDLSKTSPRQTHSRRALCTYCLIWVYDGDPSQLGSLRYLHDMVASSFSHSGVLDFSLFKDTLFFMDVFIVLFVSTVVHVSWRKNCRTPMSILPNLAR